MLKASSSLSVRPLKILFCFVIVSLFLYSKSNGADMGQMYTRNNFAPLLLFLHIPTDSGGSLLKGERYLSSQISYSNILIQEWTPKSNVFIDMEVARFAQSFYYGLTDNFSAGFEIPVLTFWKGGMDSAINRFHDAVGISRKDRNSDSNNHYIYLIDFNNTQLNNKKSGVTGIGDITLLLKYQFELNEKKIRVGFMGALKAPSGNINYMHGSGKADFGAGLSLSYAMPLVTVYSLASIVVPQHPDFFGNIEVEPFMTESFTLEYHHHARRSFLIQFDYSSNPFPKDVITLGHHSVEATFGLKQKVNKKTALNISFSEDVVSHTTPDFTINIGLSLQF